MKKMRRNEMRIFAPRFFRNVWELAGGLVGFVGMAILMILTMVLYLPSFGWSAKLYKKLWDKVVIEEDA